jgi:hypothetical protein
MLCTSEHEKVVGILQTFFKPMVEAQLSGKVFPARSNISNGWAGETIIK